MPYLYSNRSVHGTVNSTSQNATSAGGTIPRCAERDGSRADCAIELQTRYLFDASDAVAIAPASDTASGNALKVMARAHPPRSMHQLLTRVNPAEDILVGKSR